MPLINQGLSMKILKVIHGYPMRYNAGSEVYSQLLCHGLASEHEVHVFTREEDVFKPDYVMHREVDTLDPSIHLHIINMPKLRLLQRYQHEVVDQKFERLLEEINPDIVHIGHLNHLSTSLVDVIHQKKIPIVFTLHDYWLMCPRGQFLQRNSQEPWALCDGQQDSKCATQCFSGFFSGGADNQESDSAYWTKWVAQRMDQMRDVVAKVDLFIAPAQYLLERFRDEFGIPPEKLHYLDYGFNLERLKNRAREAQEPFTFGYIGTHIPAKGIQDLIIAFSHIKEECLLRIWGRFREETASLNSIISTLPSPIQRRIEWKPEYRNQEIVSDVFNHIDALVVPSIWVENSPLVIHEALQVRLPVITANVGGMAEYVRHGVNGLLFNHRDPISLSEQMRILASNPTYATDLGSRGYLQSKTKDIPGIQQHVKDVEEIYENLLTLKGRNPYAETRPLANYL
jgi:glycosyltransferase involved in cell wall biosynthesis